MDILQTLKEYGAGLQRDELDYFETELDLGSYSEDYRKECLTLIDKLRKPDSSLLTERGRGKSRKEAGAPALGFQAVQLELSDLTDAPKLTGDEKLIRQLARVRKQSNYRTQFKALLRNGGGFDQAFVMKYFAEFNPWEQKTVLTAFRFPEEFLNKYFNILDKDAISQYQEFSENFFMKHWAELNSNLVMNKGVNDWRKKEKRSRQLDVFLRLKGY